MPTFFFIMSASNFLKKVSIQNVKKLLRDKDIRDKVIGPVGKYMEYIDYLKDMGLKVIDLTDKDMVMALHKARRYGLITADAAHLAVMDRKGIRHLASSDRDFKVVEGITLWMPLS